MSARVYNDYERYGDTPVQPTQQTQLAGYYVFNQGGQPVGVAPVSRGGVSGALGLPSMAYSEPRLNLQGLTLFREVESPPVSPYAEFGSKTFGEFDIPTVTPSSSQLNAYKFAYTQGAAGAVAPAVPYPISSHMIAATKGGALAGVGEFTAGGVGAVESFWNPSVPSVWNVAYEKVGLQKGSYASDIFKQYPGYAAGNVVGEFALLGAPTGASVPKLLGKLGGKVEVYMGLKTYPELKLGNMIRTFKDNQAVVRTIRGMEGGSIRVSSETFAPRVAESWLTPSEMKGFAEGMDDLPKIRVESPPKPSSIFTEVSQGQRVQTSQLLEMRAPTQMLKAESGEMPALFPKLYTPGQMKRMLLAEDYVQEFVTLPLPKQIAAPASPQVRQIGKQWSLQSAKMADAYTQTDFISQATVQGAEPMLKLKPSSMSIASIRTRTKESDLAGIYQLPGASIMNESRIAQSFKLDTAQRQRMASSTLPDLKYKMDLPRKFRFREDDWMPKMAKRSGGSYEERINPFNQNFIRDLRRMKV